MTMKKHRSKTVLIAALIAWGFAVAYASSTYMNNFNTTYKSSAMVGNCSVCHTSIPSLNPYGSDFQKNSHNLSAIENLDSDADGSLNITEINLGTNPGDPGSKPNVDSTAPTLTLAMPLNSTTTTVAITVKATDNVGVTGYLVNENPTKPSASASGWTASAPTSYTFGGAGSQTLYAWAKDAAGNIGGIYGTVMITLPDTTAPTVTLAMPPNSTTTTVAITVTATDNVGVTGYLVNESATKPSATGGVWTASAPSSYAFQSAGTKTLYAWAKDAAGNVGGQSKSIAITTPTTDTTPPVITSFSTPPTSDTLTVKITSFSAADDTGVAGYLVTESYETPSADAADWTSSPPSQHKFSSPGMKTLHGWAKDAAGNVSTCKTSDTMIEVTGPDLSGMTMWDSAWFRVNIKNAGDGWIGNAYLNILSWDEDSSTLNARLFTQDENGQWQVDELPFHYTSGTPLRFLCSFDYAEDYAFSVAITANIDKNGNMRNATFRAVGLTYDEEEAAESDTDVRRSYAIVGTLISQKQLPPGIDALGTDGSIGDPRVSPKRSDSRDTERGSKYERAKY
jgi:hypothetical protein